jgi:hypothetical protein
MSWSVSHSESRATILPRQGQSICMWGNSSNGPCSQTWTVSLVYSAPRTPAQSTEVDQLTLQKIASRRHAVGEGSDKGTPEKGYGESLTCAGVICLLMGCKMYKKHVSCSSSSFWISQVCQSPQTPSSLAQINCWSSRWQSGTRRKPIKMNSARRR